MTLTVNHVFTNTIADMTGTVTVHDNALGTKTVAATDLVRPSDWNSVHTIAGEYIGGIAASNTTYTSGTVVLSGGANVTVGTNGQTVTISAAAQTVQTQNMVAISASNNLFSSGTVTISGFGDITVNTAAGIIRVSGSQSVQPETQTFLGGIQNSQTTYTSGTVNLSVVAGNLTIRSTTGQAFQFSASETPQTGISGIANSQTTYTSGTVTLSELGAITIRSTTGNQYQFSVNSQTVQTQHTLSVGVSNVGNTSGDTGVATGSRLVFAGGNNITLSQGTAAGATTITISAPNLGAGAMSAGVSNLGNTAGATGVTGTRLVLVGSDNITLSQTTDANGGTVSVIGGAGAGGAATLSFWHNIGGASNIGANTTNLTNSTRSLYLFPLAFNEGGYIPGVITASIVRMLLSCSASTASISQQHSVGFSLGIYKISASNSASTLSLINSASSSWTNTTLATSAATNSYIGIRWLQFSSSQWSSAPVFSNDVYYMAGFISSWSSISFNTLAVYAATHMPGGVMSGTFNAASTSLTSMGMHPWQGIYATSTTGFPASIHMTQIRKDQGAGQIVPYIALDALYTSSF